MIRPGNAATVAILLSLAASAEAQVVSGALSHAASGLPVAGALVTAYSQRGDTLPISLASAAGRFSLRIPTGREYTLYVRSIGMKALRVGVGPLSARQDTVLQLRMEPVVITLPSVEVAALNECSGNETGTAAVAQVWSEVLNALESSLVANNLVRRRFDWRIFRTEADVRTGAILLNYSRERKALTVRPFYSMAVGDLQRTGYVTVVRGSRTYYPPDETVLRDPWFVDSHCFWAERGVEQNDGLLALHFAPVNGTRNNDIRGTFWLSASTFELMSVVFNYTRVQMSGTRRPASRAVAARDSAARAEVRTDSLEMKVPSELMTPGGEVRFRRLPDGTVIVDSWRVWATDTWLDTQFSGDTPLEKTRMLREAGGAILRIDSGL
jgi:hypothetical protein